MPTIMSHLFVNSEFDFIYTAKFYPVDSIVLAVMSMRMLGIKPS
jgi:hypothetical protein